MSRILLIYASQHGRTCAIALRIAHCLRESGVGVELRDAHAELPDPVGYDAVVLGSRVQFGRHASEVVGYIRDHRTALLERPTAFFSVSMAAATPGAPADPAGYLAATFDALDWHPNEVIAFAGGLPYRRYGWFLRQIMKRINRSAGHTTDTSRDHVFTDDAAVVAFASRVASSCTPAVAARA